MLRSAIRSCNGTTRWLWASAVVATVLWGAGTFTGWQPYSIAAAGLTFLVAAASFRR